MDFSRMDRSCQDHVSQQLSHVLCGAEPGRAMFLYGMITEVTLGWHGQSILLYSSETILVLPSTSVYVTS